MNRKSWINKTISENLLTYFILQNPTGLQTFSIKLEWKFEFPHTERRPLNLQEEILKRMKRSSTTLYVQIPQDDKSKDFTGFTI
jgi:hypothetical protein